MFLLQRRGRYAAAFAHSLGGRASRLDDKKKRKRRIRTAHGCSGLSSSREAQPPKARGKKKSPKGTALCGNAFGTFRLVLYMKQSGLKPRPCRPSR